jgi:hypothetical protein
MEAKMIYEVRTYTLTPGAIPEFEKRFEAALPCRTPHSELAAFWHTEFGPLNQVIHVWPYDDLNHRSEVRRRAAKEPGWPPKAAELIVPHAVGNFYSGPFSPKLGGGLKLGNIYEMRLYQYKTGLMPTVMERFEKP